MDGIDDKLTTISNMDDEGDVYPLFKFTTTCVDDETSAWLESYGDVNRYNFLPTRQILDGWLRPHGGRLREELRGFAARVPANSPI